MSASTDSTRLPLPITLIINTNSRKGKLLFKEAVELLRDAGVSIGSTHQPKDHQETERLLKREVAKGAQTIIIGGGDGTLSACADHLVNTSLAMGILPLGTGNTFVRSVGIPTDLAGAVQTIARGHVEAIDVGRVNNQIFLNSVSLGLSAEIAGALDKETKKRLGLLAWPVVGARVVGKHRALVLRVKAAEKTFNVRTHQIVVVNGRYVAGPITAAPESSVQDSSLDVFVLGGAKKSSLARVTWQWLRGHHVHSHESSYFTTRALRIESMRKPLPANVDGEINEKTPLNLEVLPRALRVIVPHDFDAETA